MTTEIISVIIPVHNNEQYLSQCLDSVLHQSFTDIEVILINDASTDSSVQIIERYAGLDSRISTINLDINSGVSCARNAGIETARGKYLIFVDADDYWSHSRVLESLYHQIQKQPAEFITFGFCRVDDHGEQKKVVVQQPEIIEIKQAERWKVQYNIWAKLILKKHLEDHRLRFDESLVMGEDALFSVRLYSTANKVIITDDVFYCYRINPSGANNMEWDNKKLFDTVRWFKQAIDVLDAPDIRNHNTTVLQSITIERLNMLFNVLGPKAMVMLTQDEKADYFQQWSWCLRYLDQASLHQYFQSNRLQLLYEEMLALVNQGDLTALEDFFAYDRHIERNTSKISGVQLTRQQAIQLGKDILKLNSDQIRCDFGNGAFITLPKDRAHQLARQFLVNDRDILKLNFE